MIKSITVRTFLGYKLNTYNQYNNIQSQKLSEIVLQDLYEIMSFMHIAVKRQVRKLDG